MSEIAQVAASTGSGTCSRPAGRPSFARGSGARSRSTRGLAARPAPARDARRAGPDLRQVRPAPLHPPGHRPAGHRLRAEGAPGRGHALPVRAGPRGRRGGARAHPRAALPRLRGDADRGRVDRPGAPGDAPERAPGRRQGAAAERAAPDRGRPRAHVPARQPRARARPRARVHRHRRRRRRVRALDQAGARLPHRGAERRAVPPELRRLPARARAARLLELLGLAGAHARAARGRAAARPRPSSGTRCPSAARSPTASPRRGWR